MLTEFSLQALVDISKSRLSSSLTYVIFSLERPKLRHVAPNMAPFHPQFDTAAQENFVQLEYVDHINLINAGYDVDMLAEAFSNLKSLEAVSIRDFYSKSRNRDYPQVWWKTYGASTFVSNTGGLELDLPGRTYRFIQPNDPQFIYLSRIFLNILRALGKASSQPRNFEVILRHISLADYTFKIPRYVEPIIQPVLANLRTLFLDLYSYFRHIVVTRDSIPVTCHGYFLRILLSKVPNLEHLRLNFRMYGRDEAGDFLSWLSLPTLTNKVPSTGPLPETPLPIEFNKLQQLDIGMLAVYPEVLIALIRKFQTTLRTLSFHRISLLHSDNGNDNDNSKDSGNGSGNGSGNDNNAWTKFFRQLSKLDVRLTTISMSLLSQEHTAGRNARISFKHVRQPESKIWTGTDIQSGLRDFIDHMTVEKNKDGDENDSDGT